jgi:sugar phosphate isomerase/epimerase
MEAGKRKLDHFGLILGLVGSELKKDWKGTLRRLREYGYTDLEGAYSGVSKDEFLEFAKSLGMNVFASSTGLWDLKDNPEKPIQNAVSYGVKYLICYWPWLDSREKTIKEFSHDSCMRTCDIVNKAAKECGKVGIKLGIHNHDLEFTDIGGETVFEVLLKNTDTKNVIFELDLYWIEKGGGNTLEVFKKHPGRFEILHVKDMDKTPDRKIACVGDGCLNFPEIFAESEKAGVKYFILEQDKASNPMETCRKAGEYLKNIRF